MVSLMKSMLVNESVRGLAEAWGVSPEQAVVRLRRIPFVVFSHPEGRGGGRGRPGRRVSLDPRWRFWEHAGRRPLRSLVICLRTLPQLGEPFALGVPFTSAFWRPFLHPEVRILVPPETYSIWVRLFAGTSGGLGVVVDMLPDSAGSIEVEGLPVLERSFAVVDALQEYERLPNMNLLALADWIAHSTPDMGTVRRTSTARALEGDLEYLEDHRCRGRARILGHETVREAHRLAVEMSRVPEGTTFDELLDRERVRLD